MRQDFLHPPPGTKCVAALSDTIFASAVHCTAASGYSFWVIQAPPTALQVSSICQSSVCTQLVKTMQAVAPTECVMSDGFYLYGDILNPILQQCPTGIASGGNGLAGGSHTTTIVIVVVVVAVLVVVGAVLVWLRRRRSQQLGGSSRDDIAHNAYAEHPVSFPRGSEEDVPDKYVIPARPTYSDTKTTSSRWSDAREVSSVMAPRQPPLSMATEYSASAPVCETAIDLFRDPQILKSRVEYSDVTFGDFIDSGAYGSVHKGVYRNVRVAIKTLRAGPASTKSAVAKFMGEVKLLTSLSHPRIVTFLGVAWTKPEDVCVLLEFMDGGHLMALLKQYDVDPQTYMGFTPTKVKIALDVAEALAYLHARSPPVIHRDLKSNNILLAKQYNAKLTDFGVSREHANDKMTMKIGTERWMAPEVILGEDYDERADVFSFGVVLSELDTNKIPYATHELGEMKPLTIMQSIARGQLTVEFSFASDPRISALGRECVSLDPRQRPSMEAVRERIEAVLYGSGL